MSQSKHKTFISLRAIILVMALGLMALLFIPYITLTYNGATPADEKVTMARSLLQLIGEGNTLTPVNELGMFSGINFMMPIAVVFIVATFALLMVLLVIFNSHKLKKTYYQVLTGLYFVVPIFTILTINGSAKVINELSSAMLDSGAYISILLCVVFLITRRWVSFDNSASANFLDEQERTEMLLFTGSVVTVVAMFLPFFGIDIKTGLSSFKSYNFSMANFLQISGDVDMKVFFSLFSEQINLGFMSVLWLLPITALVTIVLVLMGRNDFAKKVAILQGLLAVLAPVMINSTLIANKALISGAKRISGGYGAIVMFAAGMLSLIMAITAYYNRPIVDRVAYSKKNHRFNYTLLGIAGLILYLFPHAGVTTKTLNDTGLRTMEVTKDLRLLFNQYQLASLTGNPITYVGYIVPLAIIVMFVLLVLKKDGIAKRLAMLAGVAMFVSPLLNRMAINSVISEYEIAQFRMSYVITMIVGVALVLQFITDKNSKEAITNASGKVTSSIQGAILVVFGVIQLYPLVWLFLASFMTEKEMFSGKVLQLPEVWHAEHYSKALFGTRADETIMESIQRVTGETDSSAIFQFVIGNTADGNIVRYFANSLFVVGITIAIVVIASALVSYALTRIEWKGSKIMYGFFLLGMMIPVHVALAPLYITFADIGILGTLWSLIIPYAGFGMSFAIIVLSGFMISIPKTIEEAATIDGANRFGIFTKIIMPMLKPSIATVTIFTFMGSWNELMFASIFINKGTNRTITVGINHLANAQYNTEYGLIFAGLVVASLPTLVFYLLASDRVQKSLVVGAVKE